MTNPTVQSQAGSCPALIGVADGTPSLAHQDRTSCRQAISCTAVNLLKPIWMEEIGQRLCQSTSWSRLSHLEQQVRDNLILPRGENVVAENCRTTSGGCSEVLAVDAIADEVALR